MPAEPPHTLFAVTVHHGGVTRAEIGHLSAEIRVENYRIATFAGACDDDKMATTRGPTDMGNIYLVVTDRAEGFQHRTYALVARNPFLFANFTRSPTCVPTSFDV